MARRTLFCLEVDVDRACQVVADSGNNTHRRKPRTTDTFALQAHEDLGGVGHWAFPQSHCDGVLGVCVAKLA